MPKASRVPRGVYTMALIMAIEHLRILGTPHTTCKGGGGGESKRLKSQSSIENSSENIGKFWHVQAWSASYLFYVLYSLV